MSAFVAAASPRIALATWFKAPAFSSLMRLRRIQTGYAYGRIMQVAMVDPNTRI